MRKANDKWIEADKNCGTRSNEIVSTVGAAAEVIKEKAWTLTSAFKGVAQTLMELGVNPAIFGYSSVSCNEDGYVQAHEEDEPAVQTLSEDGRLQKDLHNNINPECDNLIEKDEDVGLDHAHAFMDSVNKDMDERKSLALHEDGAHKDY